MFSQETLTFLLGLITGNIIQEKSNEDELLEVIGAHHISGRIIKIFSKNNSKFFSASFIDKLHKLHEKELMQVQNNIRCAIEIESEGNFPKPSIAIKGYTYYTLSSDSQVIRSGDIDIIPYNTSAYIDVLEKLGYTRTRPPFIHEAGEFNRRGIEIDVHYFFPIYRYQDELRKTNRFDNLNNTSYIMPFEKLEYLDVEKNIYQRIKTTNPYIYDANISILIMCAHMFMNYTNIWSISHREKPYVKLGELWDVFEMTNHDSYSKNNLLELIEKYKAHDCIKWAGIILKMVFGSNPLPIDISNETINDYPKCLWWNIWGYIPSNIYQLLSTEWYVIDDVFDSIGINKVSIGLYHSSELTYIGSSIINHFSIKFDQIWCHLLREGTINKVMRYRIDFGSAAIEIIFDSNKEPSIIGDYDSIKVIIDEEQISFRLVSDKFLLGIQEESEKNKHEKIIPFCLER